MTTTALFSAENSWPISRMGELLENLARRSRLNRHPVHIPRSPVDMIEAGDGNIGGWLNSAADYLGLEAEQVEVHYPKVTGFLIAGGPAIIELPQNGDRSNRNLVGLIRGNKRKVKILTPDLRIKKIRVEELRSAMCSPYELEISKELDKILNEVGVPSEKHHRARTSILQEHLGSIRIPAGWLLRISPGEKIIRQARHAGIILPLLLVMGLYLVQILLSVASWIVIGRGLFQGHFNLGWLFAWIILLLATIPLQIFVSDAQAELSMSAGVLFKQRLLYGTLKLEPEEIRHQGIGQFLGRVMESEAVEALAISGGFLALLSFIQLGIAALILSRGAGDGISVFLLFFWIIIILVFLWRNYLNSRQWVETYQDMTNELVENMVGHRTRLAQADPNQWHLEEDESLERYIDLSENLDRNGYQISSMITHGWIIIGFLGIIYPFVSNTASVVELAISIGGILFAAQALNSLVGGANSVINLLLAWKQIGPLFSAASRPNENPSLEFSLIEEIGDKPSVTSPDSTISKYDRRSLIQARNLSFRYPKQTRWVLQECSLKIVEEDRILLEGSSGSGKSTLAAILSGLRVNEGGTLLLLGFDRKFVGSEEWHRRIVMSPQFQENHIFSETFGFNLLMGRRWPPNANDLHEAEELCRELGLGELLDKMPSGMQQVLGESGWQLSHGERSRLFIARTLLQNADLVILDESFGALDPINMRKALHTALDRSRSILVIAHP